MMMMMMMMSVMINNYRNFECSKESALGIFIAFRRVYMQQMKMINVSIGYGCHGF